MLLQLSRYLEKHRYASLSAIALALGSTPDAVRPMVQILIDKGRVAPVKRHPQCAESACCGCALADPERFAWIEPQCPTPANDAPESIRSSDRLFPCAPVSVTDRGCADTHERRRQALDA